jgi:mono/diheme cytochrome c family protein
VTSRFRLVVVVGSLTLAGCGDSFHAGPIGYTENEQLGIDLKDKPKLQAAVTRAMANLYGPTPQQIKVPAGSGLTDGGVHLANLIQQGEGDRTEVRPIAVPRVDEASGQYMASKSTGKLLGEPQEGGYALYRKHCLHCHGVDGAGNGPTASFLFPRPRDYRKGLFKFTSTPTGAKPTREDLRKTVKYGLHGTSMPAFEALMSNRQVEQVLDYLLFLSMRGETELGLIAEAGVADEATADEAISDVVAAEIAQSVFAKWKAADSQVVRPETPRTPSSPESIARGRELFLGLNKTGNKVECAGCHGPQGRGNGPSFIDEATFTQVVFRGDPSMLPTRVGALTDKQKELWKASVDEWGDPLRPANLTRGVYKGGRRPLDLYWRLAKGINGAKMPAHLGLIKPDQIWDLVNFVLALPYDPTLLKGATLPGTPAAAPAHAALPATSPAPTEASRVAASR